MASLEPLELDANPQALYPAKTRDHSLFKPYCTQILGDLGAEIIKIEHPLRGDDTRAWGPPFAPYLPSYNPPPSSSSKSTRPTHPGESAYFLSVNRSKLSLALSFHHPLGQSLLHSLAQNCDILVENHLPNSLSKHNLSYTHLQPQNPRLIYTSITGYGQTGPLSDRAGYDVILSAQFGLMHITGSRDGPPAKVGVAVTDLSTGLYAANSILAALIQRDGLSGRGGTGQGQHIDISLSDVQIATLSNIASSVLVSGGRDSGRWGTSHPSIVPYRAFFTSDSAIILGAGNDKLFGILAQRLGHPEWAGDARYATPPLRVANRDALEKEIEGVMRGKTTREWCAVLEGSGLPFGEINDVRDSLDHAHTRARGMVRKILHPACGELEVVGPAVKFGGFDVGGGGGGGGEGEVDKRKEYLRPPPLLGEHTDDVLTRILGLRADEIARLRAEGVVA